MSACRKTECGLSKNNTMSNRAVRQRSDLLFIAASFWFKESPCAVRTNTASLDWLCTLFVLSTLLVFEHIYRGFLLSTLVLCCPMGTTKHCCYGARRSSYRYADTDRMKNVVFNWLKCYIMQMGVGGVWFSGKKRYEGVMFNVISVTGGGVGGGLISRKITLRNTWMIPMYCSIDKSRASYCTLGQLYYEKWVTSKTKLKLYSEPRHANLLVSFVQQFPWMYFAKNLVYMTNYFIEY